MSFFEGVCMDIWDIWPVVFLIFCMMVFGVLGWIELFGILLGCEELFSYLMHAF
jgi:hypothetical protein